MNLKKSLEKWLLTNRLNYAFENDYIFTIKDVGRCLMIEGDNGIIVNEKFELILGEEDNKRLTESEGELELFVFKFGTKWYYTSESELKLTELRYLGIEKDCNESFPFLGVHGAYDLCNGSRIYTDWCKKAKFCGITALGIIEDNTLAGTLEFQNACEKNKLKSIIGETVTVKGQQGLYTVKLFVQNDIGWRNLLNINSCINVHNEERFVTEWQLFDHAEGLICVLTPEVKLSETWASYDMAFPKLYYQFDIAQWSSSQKDDEWLQSIQLYIKEYRTKLKPVLIQDAYYLEKSDAGIRKDLNAIGKVSFKNQSSDQYFKTPNEAIWGALALFEHEERSAEFIFAATDNAKEIADTDFKIETGKLHLPLYKMNEEENILFSGDKDSMMWTLIEKGIKEKGIDKFDNINEHLDRIDMEMKVICEAKLQDYFLITWDILNWCRTQGILVGYGRGSAAGCLVAYLLGIVQVNPLDYDLLFERFLNEGRLYKKKKVEGCEITDDDGISFETDDVNLISNADAMGLKMVYKEIEIKVVGSMPDIDNDIQGNRREEVKRYIEQRYGGTRVSGIGTYGTLKIKSALADLARRSGISQGMMAYLSGAISEDDLDYAGFFKYALKDNNKLLKDFIQDNPVLIEKLSLILDQPKTASSHAAAVVIVPESKDGIFDQFPVKKVDGLLVSEWEMEGVEQAGFLKMDILGLKQLDKFADIIELIKKHHGIEIDLNSIPLDDGMVYEYFGAGYNEDAFQFKGIGLKGFTRDLKPEVIEDLIATVALYRPGPIEMKAHIDYVKRKNGGRITYPYGTEEILKTTYGALCYQEQVQKIAEVVAGFTPNEADDIRKAIGKKLPELMAQYKNRFIEGAVKNGCPKQEAEQMWDDIEGFGAYSFNKSHATCYAITGYYCQWFKVHYPLEFWIVSLKHASDAQIVNRLAEMSLTGNEKVGGPHINYSTDSFTTDGDRIYWSLQSIKQVGPQALKDILEERAKGEFFSITEFATRLKGSAVKKNVVINLIFSGAFDHLHKINKKEIMFRHGVLKQYVDAFGSKDDKAILGTTCNWENYQWILKQREVCGLGMINVKTLLDKVGMKEEVKRTEDGKIRRFTHFSIAEVLSIDEKDFAQKGPIVGGIITKLEEKTSKKSDKGPFVLIEISDGASTLSGVMWNEQYENNKSLLKVNDLLFMKDVWIKYDDRFRRSNVFYVTEHTKIAALKQ